MNGPRPVRAVVAITLLTAVTTVATASALAVLPSSAPKLRVTPATGTPRSTFIVAFRAPVASGRSVEGGMLRRYDLTASGPDGATGCSDSESLAPTAARAGEWMRVRLKPTGADPSWCAGAWSGTVNEVAVPACGPPVDRSEMILCPQYIALVDRIGRFEFRVIAGPGR